MLNYNKAPRQNLVTLPMKSVLKFNRSYFVIAILLFVIELLIALYVNDQIIRPYFGDFLVVILIYCFIKSFLDSANLVTAIGVLIFSFLLEISQYFNIVNLLGLGHSKLARTVIGTSFEWIDLIAYTLGIVFVIYIENQVSKKMKQNLK
jgi:DNA integrity scanning protein DisA with diadenylate cyclase activity